MSFASKRLVKIFYFKQSVKNYEGWTYKIMEQNDTDTKKKK